jgi:hypothetical protein
MRTPLGNDKRGDQQEFVMIWLSVLTTVVLAIAGFVGIVF